VPGPIQPPQPYLAVFWWSPNNLRSRCLVFIHVVLDLVVAIRGEAVPREPAGLANPLAELREQDQG